MEFEVKLSNGETLAEQDIEIIVAEIIDILKSRQMSLPAIELILKRTLNEASAKAVLR